MRAVQGVRHQEHGRLFKYISFHYCCSSGGKGVMLTEYKLGSLEAKLGAKIASVTSGHNVTCF